MVKKKEEKRLALDTIEYNVSEGNVFDIYAVYVMNKKKCSFKDLDL